MEPVLTRVDPAGRLSIPAQHRKALGLEAGGPVVIALVDGEVRIRPVAAAMAELQAETTRFLESPRASVEVFLAERRAEAEREEAELARDSTAGRPRPCGAEGEGGDGR